MPFNERTLMVLGEEKYNKVTNKNICVIGVGGVGGSVVENLTRFGIKNLTIIDFDTVDISNLNRQIISNINVLGQDKVEVAKARMLSINPDCNITTHKAFISADNLKDFKLTKFDYVIDAIDSVTAKLALIEYCHNNDINIISSMGTGNRIDISGFVIDTVENTKGNGCGLSRIVRKELNKRGVENHISLFNQKPPESKAVNSANGRNAPGSTPFAPNLAGIMISQYVVDRLMNE